MLPVLLTNKMTFQVQVLFTINLRLVKLSTVTAYVFHWCIRKERKEECDKINELEKIWHAILMCVCFPLCFLFSATWPDGVRRLAKSYLKNPMIVYVGTLDLTVSCPVLFWFFPFLLQKNLCLSQEIFCL